MKARRPTPSPKNKIEPAPAPSLSPMGYDIWARNLTLPAAFRDFDTPYIPGPFTEIVEGLYNGYLRDQHGMVWGRQGDQPYFKSGWIEKNRWGIVQMWDNLEKRQPRKKN